MDEAGDDFVAVVGEIRDRKRCGVERFFSRNRTMINIRRVP